MSWFGLILLAVTAENFAFVRIFGLGTFLEKGFVRKNILTVGLLTEIVLVLTVAVLGLLKSVLPSEAAVILLCILVACAVTLGCGAVLRARRPEAYASSESYLPSLIVNGAACAYIVLQNGTFSYGEEIVYAAAAGVGILLAGILLKVVLERVRYASVPEAFKGLPISLICASLLSLIFIAFDGMKNIF